MDEPQYSDKINVKTFKRKVSETFSNDFTADHFQTGKSWSTEKKQKIAERCLVTQDLKFSSVVFMNTKLFTLLKENYEEISKVPQNENFKTDLDSCNSEEQSKHEFLGKSLHEDFKKDEIEIRFLGQSGPDENDTNLTSVLASKSSQGTTNFPSTTSESFFLKYSTATPESIANYTDLPFDCKNSAEGSNSTQNSKKLSIASYESTSALIAINSEKTSTLSKPIDCFPLNELEESKKSKETQNFQSLKQVEAQTKKETKAGTIKQKHKNSVKNQRVDEAKILELENHIRKIAYMLKNPKLSSLKKENAIELPLKLRQQMNHIVRKVAINDPTNAEHVEKSSSVSEEYAIEISVRIMSPRQSSSKQAEFKVLGHQPLTVLRDAFYCINDFLVSNKTSQQQIQNNANSKLSSSFFFIENVFYNDMRHENAIDYSKNIIEHYAHNQNFRATTMQGSRFEDLEIRIGYPYLFCHDGNCEHIVYFSDISYKKLDSRVQLHSHYPLQTFRERSSRHKCRMCLLYPASFVATNDFHAGETPCYFCRHCYHAFHYDNNNKLLLDHDIYPYATTIL